jgi:hypothetical protein
MRNITPPVRALLEAARDKRSPYPDQCGEREQRRIDKQLKGLIGDGLIQRRTTQRNHEPFVIIQLTQAGQSTLARA